MYDEMLEKMNDIIQRMPVSAGLFSNVIRVFVSFDRACIYIFQKKNVKPLPDDKTQEADANANDKMQRPQTAHSSGPTQKQKRNKERQH